MLSIRHVNFVDNFSLPREVAQNHPSMTGRAAIRHAASIVLPLLLASPCAAEDLSVPPGAVERLEQGSVVISPAICTAFAADASVPGAAYQAGIDVNGRKVAPADLPSSAPLELDNFPIEIRKNLDGVFGVPPAGGAFGAKAILGYVTVRGDQAFFNGKALSTDQNAALIAACRKVGARRPVRE